MTAVEPLITVEQLAAIAGVSKATVYGWNYKGTGPTPTRTGAKRGPVRYAAADVRAWLRAHRQPITP